MNITSSIQPSKRLLELPIYVFAEIAEIKSKLDPNWLIDLSLGSPDSRTPEIILQTLRNKLDLTKNHGYPPFDGKITLRQGIVEWCKRRFGFVLKESQVLPLIGSKEGLAHLPLAYIDPGDISLVPNPHYPVHARGTIIAGGQVHYMPLKQENDFLPELNSIPVDVANKAKLMILSYPNNPTGAIASPGFMKEAVEFARKYNILLCNDLAYSELGFFEHQPQSIFEYLSIDEPAVEFFTFSKTYHMAGWRIGFCIGSEEVIKTLYTLKSNLDYGVSGAIQDTALDALSMPDSYYQELRNLYERRAETTYKKLTDKLSWNIFKPGGAMYLWIPAPEKYEGDGTQFARDLLSKQGIVCTPGIAFGSEGERYVRLALVQPEDKLEEAGERIIKAYS
ncbi:MAG: aminotransferase class I/II-fold pyridoxal phosphate-dependent enzyme [Candidatus Caenarcaniphilales bacterium]|nr:aminotransferase class I/II-fold pyridoxal phosphate-dependent enzyme [Candidatus Caenarcaniphilales bacterium]